MIRTIIVILLVVCLAARNHGDLPALLGNSAVGPNMEAPCQCQGYFTKQARVCSNNNKEYTTACELAAAIKADPTLGLRCTGPCPCDDSAMLRVAKLTGSCNATVPLKKTKLFVKCSPITRFCMTDDSELTRANVYCKMANTPGLGLRCAGSCSECQNYNCPARLALALPMYDDCPSG